MADKAELVIAALKQRIGEIVSNYETQLALVRAELTVLMEQQEAKEKETIDYAEYIEKKVESAASGAAE